VRDRRRKGGWKTSRSKACAARPKTDEVLKLKSGGNSVAEIVRLTRHQPGERPSDRRGGCLAGARQRRRTDRSGIVSVRITSQNLMLREDSAVMARTDPPKFGPFQLSTLVKSRPPVSRQLVGPSHN
jgi:hypothetical protein